MDNTERARAEKVLIRYGNYITINDYGLALAATHNIIKQIESEFKESQLDLGYCSCSFPNTDSRDTFSACRRCHLPVKVG